MNNLSVLIVEGHRLLADAWSVLLQKKNAFNVTICTEGQPAALEIVKAQTPDIIIIDISSANIREHDLIRILLKQYPRLKIIAVSIAELPVDAGELLKVGVRAYLTKSAGFDDLLNAITAVAGGGIYISAVNQEPLQRDSTGKSATPVKSLTRKEREVASYIGDGISAKEIAGKLGLSIKTVQTHLHNIMKKLGLRNSAALAGFLHDAAR